MIIVFDINKNLDKYMGRYNYKYSSRNSFKYK